jgi:hypothetical protein
MKRNVSTMRWLLSLAVLAGLCFNAAGQSLTRVEAAPVAQATSCFGNTITQWTFTGNTTNPSAGYGTLSGTGISGPSYVSSGIANPPAISFSGWNIASLDTGKYVEIGISTAGRYSISLMLTSNVSSISGPDQFDLQYSIDGGGFTSAGVRSITVDELTYIYDFTSDGAFDNKNSVVFRLYAYGASSSTSTWRIDNVSITGTCVIPGDTPTATASLPPFSPQSVIINEVAWMGTLASPDYEWIELYNTTGSDINLNNWTISTADGSPNITILGASLVTTIPANGYFLLRNANVFSSDVTTLSYQYSGSLSDSGETLTLRDPGNTIIDTANGNGGNWPAGTLTTAVKHGTMERMGSGIDVDSLWVTANPGLWNKHDVAGNIIHGTPGVRNWGYDITNTPTSTSTPTSTRTVTPTATITFTPVPNKAVLINEIAWMGTAASANDEWIELYNPSTTASVDLTGWHIFSFRPGSSTNLDTVYMDIVFDDNYCVNFSCEIGPGKYFLMERGSDDVILDIDADMIYPTTSKTQMSNSGEMLILCSPGNISAGVCKPSTRNLPTMVTDVVNLYDPPSVLTTNPWPAGSSSTFGSMERHSWHSNEDTNWYSHTGGNPHWGHDRNWNQTTVNANLIKGTPGHSNWAVTITATPRASATPTRTRTPAALPAPILVINEFLARSGTDWNNDGKVDVGDEFIEVINAGIVNVSLGGYKLDDYELDADGKVISNGFTLPSQTLKPGEKMVYYGSQTGILLDDSGDTVRLFRSTTLVDAVSYPVVKILDSSICRYTDGYGTWIMGCFPTPGRPNELMGDRLPTVSDGPVTACYLPDSTPEEFVLAECGESGLGIWNPFYWDSLPGEGDEVWQPDERNKAPVIYQ